MRSLIALGAAALVALAAPIAGADEGKRAKVYRAHLTANDAAATAGIPDARGRAQLVDGRKRDKVSLHMKGLKSGETYLWHVHQATGEGDPCAAGSTVGNPAPYPGWEYRTLTARPSGNASSKGRSTTFPVADEDTGFAYYVNVHLLDGTVVACGVLERKAKKSKGDDDDASAERGHSQGRGQSEHGKGQGRGHDRHDHGDD